MMGPFLDDHRVRGRSKRKRKTFFVQLRKLKENGYSARNNKDGDTSSLPRLKEISQISATFINCVLLGYVLHCLRSTSI